VGGDSTLVSQKFRVPTRPADQDHIGMDFDKKAAAYFAKEST